MLPVFHFDPMLLTTAAIWAVAIGKRKPRMLPGLFKVVRKNL
jgi:hypothetical protein